MDLLSELENMAINAANEPNTDDFEPEPETIARWQKLFHYTYAEAVEHIKQHRANLSRAQTCPTSTGNSSAPKGKPKATTVKPTSIP